MENFKAQYIEKRLGRERQVLDRAMDDKEFRTRLLKDPKGTLSATYGITIPADGDVKVIAATSRDLKAAVENGRFRADLYYRLRLLSVHVPSVRARGDDWRLILEHYLARLAQGQSRSKAFSDRALSLLGAYDWPGNVRELKGTVETGLWLSDGEMIEPHDFVESLEAAARMQQLGKIPIAHEGDTVYQRLVGRDGDFWSLVHRPFLDRQFNRSEIRQVVARGHHKLKPAEAGGACASPASAAPASAAPAAWVAEVEEGTVALADESPPDFATSGRLATRGGWRAETLRLPCPLLDDWPQPLLAATNGNPLERPLHPVLRPRRRRWKSSFDVETWPHARPASWPSASSRASAA